MSTSTAHATASASQPRINELEPEYRDGVGSESGSELSDNDEQEEGWEDWVEDGDEDGESSALGQPTKSLFSDQVLPSPEKALEHDHANFGIDLIGLVGQIGLDFHQIIRLVNYIRATNPPKEEIQSLTGEALFLQDDTFLTPVVPNDPLLQLDIEELAESRQPSTSSSAAHPSQTIQDLNRQIAALQQQLAVSQSAILEQRHFLEKEFQKRFSGSGVGAGMDDGAERSTRLMEKGKKRDDDTHYFHSYSQNEIHEIMLKDAVRTDSYRNFILSNPSIFKDAVVLDLGCGTGILSLFCAQAGAKRVYAVDASDVAYKAMRNVKENGYEGVVKVVKGKLEDLPDEELDKVDIIVSEWMGYFLLYESMLDSVLVARDRFLKPGGLMVPSQCSIQLAAISDQAYISSHVTYWDSVYGLKMSSMKDEIGKEAEVDVFRADTLISDVASIKDVHMHKDSVADADFVNEEWTLRVSRDGEMHGFLGWFDTFFTRDGRPVPSLSLQDPSARQLEEGEVAFTTGPHGTPGHWKQSFFLLNEFVQVMKGDTLKGSFRCRKSRTNSRELEVEVVWRVHGKDRKDRIQSWVVS